MKSLNRILSYTKKYWKFLFLSVVTASFYGLFSAAPTYVIKHTVDKIFVNKVDYLLIPFLLGFLLLFSLKAAFMYLSNYYMNWVGNKVINDIRYDLFKKIIYFPISFFQKKTTGQLMSHFLNDIQMIQNASSSAIKNGVRSFFEAIFLLVVAFSQNWKLAIIMLLVAPLIAISIRQTGKAVKGASINIQKNMGDISAILQEVIVGIREVKAFNGEQTEKNRFLKYLKNCFSAIMRNVHFESLAPALIEVIAMIGSSVVFYVAAHQIMNGTITAGELSAFFAATLLSYQPLKRLINVYAEIQYGLAAADRIFGLMDKKYELIKENLNIAAPIIRNNVPCEINFNNVSFNYNKETKVLKDVNLLIGKSQRVGLIGPSGSGKSTLCDLLLGFIKPTTGTIFINGQDITKIPLSILRNKIGYVGQKTFLFNDTICANVAYCQSDKTEQDIFKACKIAHADEFIQKLPNKYQTIVGENGNKLSGGQKQRLTIARAILKNPDILIFDEATSALDQESENMIRLALEEIGENKTVIIISHRLSFIEKMDRILAIQNMQINEIEKSFIQKQMNQNFFGEYN